MKQQNEFRVSHITWPRRDFDPNSREDLDVYRYFLQHQKWRDTCPFILEWPFVCIQEMIEHKIVRQHISGLIKGMDIKPKKKTPA